MRVTKAPEERRAELVAAARALFDRDGVEKTRVKDIVKRVGVAQGAFYYYFRSKEEIVDAVVMQVTAELEESIGHIMADDTSAFETTLVALVELYLDLIDQFTEDAAQALPSVMEDPFANNAPMQQGRAIVMEQLAQHVSRAVTQGYVQVQHPEFAIKVLEAGLLHMACREMPTKAMVYAMVEQMLGLAEGSLAGGAIEKKTKENRTNGIAL